MSIRCCKSTDTSNARLKLQVRCEFVKFSQGGEGLQCVEGSRADCGQLVVVQRQQSHVVEPCETVVVDTADFVIPQHPRGDGN